MKNESSIEIRTAGLEDIPLLVEHHRKMFMEILQNQGANPELTDFQRIDREYENKLKNEIGGDCVAWMAQNANAFLASGAVTVISMVPVPKDYSYRVGYLHSVYTEKNYREIGLAGRIVQEAVHYCKSRSIKRLILNASKAAKPLYDQFGFEEVENHMRLWIQGIQKLTIIGED